VSVFENKVLRRGGSSRRMANLDNQIKKGDLGGTLSI
jgi:hypothetical protein